MRDDPDSCRAIARFDEGVPELDTVTKVILGGPEGSFDLLFPLTRQTQYYASVFELPEVCILSDCYWLAERWHADLHLITGVWQPYSETYLQM